MNSLERALTSLDGLSIGDAFGQCFFQTENKLLLDEGNQLPEAPWYFTDDTEMTLSVIAILRNYGEIDQDILAKSFAKHYSYDRAYGPSMHRVLARINAGEAWQDVVASAFEGQGSYGNGAAMRVAPLGAYFADDLGLLVKQASLSAEVTHGHPEGIAGAVAVALAAAQACLCRNAGVRPRHAEFLGEIIALLPQSEVRSKLVRAQTMTTVGNMDFPVSVLGNGNNMSAQDTVPLALWCCGQSLEDFEKAMWLTVSAGGDRDTLCAIVGGVVASFVGSEGIPDSWRTKRETLPGWYLDTHR
ncbi:ADP-ribosylglycohydrolase family protein [Undibacterium sp. CY18W]|uniref:ADP-ribosylglycohydrolase family protein n=1 Tax=Undibacterium hunanense TaxID=2762292 RepID=A0ABR6ZUV8_9BURK|nr:ADP-ribosylglycohydrolase family protein [Undibacterium hunanense]MBC3919638.1 ADP-ribosylglycohydrolase family protein [Undibacterium hunanense]